MESEKSHREKTIAAMSMGFLVAAVCFTIIDAATTIATKGGFEKVFTEMMNKDQELPIITKLLVTSISNVTYGIIFTALILILILKELLVHNRRITLVTNIVVAVSAIAYIPIYIAAIFLPMLEIIAQLRNN